MDGNVGLMIGRSRPGGMVKNMQPAQAAGLPRGSGKTPGGTGNSGQTAATGPA